jgi:hypothetical protein
VVSFLSGFLTKGPHAFLFTPIHATCPAHLILDFITLIFGEEYKSRRSSLLDFLRPHLAASLSDPKIFLSAKFSNPRKYIKTDIRQKCNS